MISIFNLAPIEFRLKCIERKLDQLMEQAGIEATPIPGVCKEVSDKIMTLVLDNEKIKAVKEYRIATGLNLKDAKTFIWSLSDSQYR
jgi:ribosomal protein L7/L12